MVRGNAQTTVGVMLKSWQGAGLQGVEEFTKTEVSQLSSTVKRKRIQITLLKTLLPMSSEPINAAITTFQCYARSNAIN